MINILFRLVRYEWMIAFKFVEESLVLDYIFVEEFKFYFNVF
jgi:hypothetical protein